MRYHVVDVFAEAPLEGNPLTVVTDAQDLSPERMQAIARETNHSETTFVTGPEQDGAWPVRIFTPQTELPFAGHPTLGTAYVLDASALHLAVGRVPVKHDGDVLWMTQPNAHTERPLPLDMIQGCLGVKPRAAQLASTGTPVGLIEVDDSDAVRAARLSASRYTGPEVAGLYVFTTKGDHDVHARFFADFVGITEDPATGGAAGPLAAHLAARGELEHPRIIRQGIEMGRPSTIHIAYTDGRPLVGGKVIPIAQGRLLV